MATIRNLKLNSFITCLLSISQKQTLMVRDKNGNGTGRPPNVAPIISNSSQYRLRRSLATVGFKLGGSDLVTQFRR